MRHLILGSEGQVGKYVCDEVEANGDEVIRFDLALSKEHDLRMPEGIGIDFELAMDRADFVHFLAYDVGGSTYLQKNQNAFEYIDNNVRIMKNVFNMIKKYDKPFYFASSQMSNMTDSVYGQLKAVGESYTRALGGGIVRFWNVYGYESDPEKTHVITDFIKQASSEYKILCKTDGQEQRHFTHAKDAAWMLYNITKYYKFLNKSIYWDVTRSENRDPNDREGDGWVTIESVAKDISDYFDVPVYFSKNIDKIQTVKNEIDGYLQRAIINQDFKAVYHKWITLTDGIIDMIERIAKDD